MDTFGQKFFVKTSRKRNSFFLLYFHNESHAPFSCFTMKKFTFANVKGEVDAHYYRTVYTIFSCDFYCWNIIRCIATTRFFIDIKVYKNRSSVIVCIWYDCFILAFFYNRWIFMIREIIIAWPLFLIHSIAIVMYCSINIYGRFLNTYNSFNTIWTVKYSVSFSLRNENKCYFWYVNSISTIVLLIIDKWKQIC